jgi:hypothetical protein
MTQRSRLPRAELQIEHWPQVDARALDRAARRTFMLRRASVLAYAKGALAIEAVQPGLDRKTLMRMVRRALQPHDDGRLWGWRALVPHTRVKTFERTVRPKVFMCGTVQSCAVTASRRRRTRLANPGRLEERRAPQRVLRTRARRRALQSLRRRSQGRSYRSLYSASSGGSSRS